MTITRTTDTASTEQASPVVTREDVVSITQDVWTSFLELQLLEGPESDGLAGHTMTGTVAISGAWMGTVSLQVPGALARRAAAAMFATDGAALDEAEVVDALGELTNMIGGNIKSLVPAPSQLSLPSVVEGDGCVVRTPGGSLVERVVLDCDGQPVAVAVWRV